MHSVGNCGISCHGLMDYEEFIFLWHIDKRDFFFGNEIGVLVGVSASLSFAIHELENPHVTVLSCLPGTTEYKNINQLSPFADEVIIVTSLLKEDYSKRPAIEETINGQQILNIIGAFV